MRDPTRSYLQLSISTRQLNYTPSSSVPSVSRSGKLRSPGESGHCGHGAHRRCACLALDLRLFDVGLETEKARERGGAQGLGQLRNQGHVEEKPAMDRKSRILVSQNSQNSQGGGVLRIKATSRRKLGPPRRGNPPALADFKLCEDTSAVSVVNSRHRQTKGCT